MGMQTALRELVADEEGQADVLPGFAVHGMGPGGVVAEGQRERLEQLGITCVLNDWHETSMEEPN